MRLLAIVLGAFAVGGHGTANLRASWDGGIVDRAWRDAIRGLGDKGPLRTGTSPILSAIKIDAATLASGPTIEGKPSVRVTFDIYNGGDDGLGDLVFELVLVEKGPRTPSSPPRPIVAGPLTVRSKVVLPPGYSYSFDIMLRDMSADGCGCEPQVRILDAHPVDSPDPRATESPSP